MADFLLYALHCRAVYRRSGGATRMFCGLAPHVLLWRHPGTCLAAGSRAGDFIEHPLQLAIITSCVVFASVLLLLERRQMLATDTLLGIIAHSTLAFGLLVLSLSDMVQINLMAFCLEIC
jgi:zinc transport system permease protein